MIGTLALHANVNTLLAAAICGGFFAATFHIVRPANRAILFVSLLVVLQLGRTQGLRLCGDSPLTANFATTLWAALDAR